MKQLAARFCLIQVAGREEPPVDEVAIPVVAIIAWASVVIFSMYQRSRRREMAHRERLAMIERGLVPPPETDPAGFERLMGMDRDYSDRRGNSVRGGLILIAVGIGVAMIIALSSGEFGVGVGVGSLLVLIGVALLLSSAWETRAMPPGPPPVPPSGTDPTHPR